MAFRGAIFAAFVVSALVCACVAAQGGKRTLVLLNDHSIKQSHSIFFRSLNDRGYELTFSLADDASLALSKYGEQLYDNVILFSPGVDEFGGSVDVTSLLQFVDAGGNVLVAASSAISDPIREFASECGIEFDEEKTAVIDHFNFDAADKGDHTLIVADDVIKVEAIAGPKPVSSVLFRGIGLTFNKDSSLILPLVRASATAYSYFPDEKITTPPHAVGRDTVLVAAVQARNNARVVFSGSLELFSNNFFQSQARGKESGNRVFATELSSWLFHERGVLKIGAVSHRRVPDNVTPDVYTIMEDLEYSIEITELKNGQWVPYKATDVQLSFVRLDPWVRVFLAHDNKGKFSTTFKIPDVYGVYKLSIDYRREGYTYLEQATQVSVRPLRHNQYERFIVSAYPYYAGAFSMMAGLFVFALVFLNNRAPASEKPKQH